MGGFLAYAGNVRGLDESNAEGDDLAWLDEVGQHLDREGDVAAGMAMITDRLSSISRDVTRAEWNQIAETLRRHPVADIIYECPMTAHALRKPRGYPGDADLIDFMYRPASVQSRVTGASRIGREIYNFVSDVPGAHDVRERRVRLGEAIDRTVAANANARILSVGAGTMRELELSRAARAGAIRELVALDHDPASLDTACHNPDGTVREFVRPLRLNVKHLLVKPPQPETYDLIYAAGIYDYLPQRVALELTKRLFEQLEPGGRLLLANFLPIWEAGYMEVFMDWHLIYRTPRQIEPSRASTRFFRGGRNCVGYLEIERVG
jgi:hypothetical protein